MLATLSLLPLLALAPQDSPAPPPRHPVSVLYAGEPGTPREKAYVDFLRGRFEKVGTTTPEELLKSNGAGFDVIVADGTVEEAPGNRLKMSGCTKSISFPESWSRPTVLIASAGKAADKSSKIGWL